MDRWDFSLENKICECCNGEGEILEIGNHHESTGWIPCPIKLFQGHGFPTCGDDNKLHFDPYDLQNQKKIKEKFICG